MFHVILVFWVSWNSPYLSSCRGIAERGFISSIGYLSL